MPTTSSELALFLILLSGVLLFFAWWSLRLRKGIRVQLWVVGLFGTFYVLVFLLVEAEVLHLPWGGVAHAAAFVDLLLLVLGAIPAFRYTSRTTQFERTASGHWVYRGRLAIPAAWLAFFLLRYGVELALLGRVYLFTPTAPSQATSIPAFAASLILVDALFAASTGIVLGNALAIYWNHRRQRRRSPVPVGAADSVEPVSPSAPPTAGGNTR